MLFCCETPQMFCGLRHFSPRLSIDMAHEEMTTEIVILGELFLFKDADKKQRNSDKRLTLTQNLQCSCQFVAPA